MKKMTDAEIYKAGQDDDRSKYKKIDKDLLHMAKCGYTQDQLQVGVHFHKNKDYKEAFYWYEKAALKEALNIDVIDSAVIAAQCALAKLYSLGKGIPKDHKKAFYWFEKVAQQEPDPYSQTVESAQYQLARLYKSGNGVRQDYKQVAYWYEKAANQGFSIAQYDLGILYYSGEGVLKSLKDSAYWIKKASENKKDFKISAAAEKRDSKVSAAAEKAWYEYELWKYE